MSTAPEPTTKSWNYFLNNKNNIRSVIEQFLDEDQWQSMIGPFGSKSIYTVEDFDKAVISKDTKILASIMNDAWGRAPEDRRVYSIPGFTEMCNLLDETYTRILRHRRRII